MPRVKTEQVPKHDKSKMTASAYGKLRSLLANNGYSQQFIKDHIGTSLGGKDKSDILQKLEAAMKTTEAKDVRDNRKPVKIKKKGSSTKNIASRGRMV